MLNQNRNYLQSSIDPISNIQGLAKRIINKIRRIKLLPIILKSIIANKIFDNLILFCQHRLEQEVQHIYLKKPMIVGPKDRLHISNLAAKNNFLVNTNSGEVYIGDYVFFGKNVCLITGTHDFTKFDKERMDTSAKKGRDIVVEQGAWIASNVTILGPCTIGKHAVVAAGSVVTKDVAPFTIVAGVPARVIKHIEQKTEEKHIVVESFIQQTV